MNLSQWVKTLWTKNLRKSPQDTHGRRRSPLLSVEALEDRCVPSVVSNTNDSGAGSLRDAIVNSTPNGGIVTFNLPANSTISLTTGEIVITNNLTITGPGATSLTVNGNANGAVFLNNATTGTTISGLTIQNGKSTIAGGGIFNNGTLTLTNDVVQNNTTTASTGGGGGGVFSQVGTLTVIGCSFINNKVITSTTTDGGGGIDINTASTGANTIVNSQILDNDSSTNGGGVENKAGTLTISASTLSVNAAAVSGGGIGNAGTLVVTSSTLQGNNSNGTGTNGGGGIENEAGATATITGSTVGSNTATGGNGGGVVSFGTLTITASSISSNTALFGGAITVLNSSLMLINSTVSGNRATTTGDTTTAGTCGGLVVFSNSTTTAATATLTQDTFSNNTAASAIDPKDLLVQQSGTGVASATLANTILGSTATPNPNAATAGGGTITSKGNNLSFDGTGAATGTDLKGDPLLGALANNGGPTLTQALLTNSPAIGKGSSALALDQNGKALTSDQRDFPFPSSSPSIGAYQVVTTFVVTTLTDEDNGSPDPTLGTGTSLREAINAATVNPGGGTITFEAGLTGTLTLTLGVFVLNANIPITITGPGASSVAIDGNKTTNAFAVSGTDTISGLTIQNGAFNDGGGILQNGGTLTLQNMIFNNDVATGSNGNGGAVNDGGGTLIVTFCTFTNNKAATGGGGIYINTTSTTNSISASTFTGNSAATNGGGIEIAAGTLSVTGSIISGNAANGTGSNGGGGIEALAGSLTVTNTTLDSNTAAFAGGGIRIEAGTVVLASSTISNNKAQLSGGLSVNNASLFLINSTVSGNQATTTTDTAANTAAGLAEYTFNNLGNASVTLTNDTFANNTAASAADAKDLGVFQGGTGTATATLGNTILGSTATTNPNAIATGGGTITSKGNNLSFDGTGAATTTDLKGNPLLGNLANNGGTNLTQIPLPNSPVLNAGSNTLAVDPNGKALTTDETNGPRIIDTTVDIGAVEAPASKDTIQFQVTSVNINENAGTLTVTVTRTGGTYNAVTATVSAGGTSDTAVAGVDYSGLPQTIKFASGATTTSFNVTILNPITTAAGTKTLTLTLSKPTGATLGTQSTEAVTITDNAPGSGGTGNGVNGLLAFSSATYSATEASGSVTLTISRTNGTTGAVSVQYLVSAATSLATKYQSTPGTDFNGAMSGTLNFASGVASQTITFTLLNPNLVEENTQFLVTLSQPTGGATVGSQATATVTIVDTDLPAVPNATPALATLQKAGIGFGTSTEHYQHFVLSAYATYLQRVPSATELAYWVNLMQEYETNHATGLRQQDIEAGFLDSAEYLSRNGGTPNKAWLDSIYQNLLGRAPDPNGEAFWLGQLAAGVSPQTVAEGFTDSQERLSDRVTATYQTLLGRAPDSNGLAYWINIFNTGGTTEDINSGFAGSTEYYNKVNGSLGGGSAGNSAEWVREAYLDILGRAAQVSEMTYWLNFLNQPS